jgi:hypothetical protein
MGRLFYSNGISVKVKAEKFYEIQTKSKPSSQKSSTERSYCFYSFHFQLNYSIVK